MYMLWSGLWIIKNLKLMTMGAAPILLQATAATLLAGIVGAFLFFRLRQTEALPSKQNDLHLLYPRFILLEALSDQIHKLPSLVSRNEWYPFVTHFTSILNKIVENEGNTSASNVSADQLFDNAPVQDQSADPGNVAKLSEGIDQHLVTYLQSVPELSCLVEGYLPQSGQTWMEFLNTAVDPQELELAMDTKLHNEAELMKACIQLVKGMVERIKGYRVQDTRRGAVKISDLPPPAGYRVEKVFYATDRQVTEDCEYLGSRRKVPSHALQDDGSGDDEAGDTDVSDPEAATNSSEIPRSNINGALHYGVVLVGVPSEHQKGKVELPKFNEEASPLSHVVILAIDTTVQSSEQGFVQIVRSDMLENEKLGGDGNEVLVYIHGYNVRFKDAAKRAAQVKCDIQFQGALICYSWASKGNLFGYKHDAKTVKQTVDSLAKFLHLCFTQLGATKLHILAHSMGNRALIAALNKVLTEVETVAPLRNVILAAADERRNRFEKLVNSAAKHKPGPRFTVYCSSVDVALHASRAVNWRTPLGDIRGYFQLDDQQVSLLELKNVDTIDVTGMDLNTLHHSYYGDVPEVLQDIQQLLKLNYGAKQRAGPRNPERFIKHVTYRGKQFYAFQPSFWSG